MCILIHQKFAVWKTAPDIYSFIKVVSFCVFSLTAGSDLLFCLSPFSHSAPNPSFNWLTCQLNTVFDLPKTPDTADLKWTMRSWIKAIWNRISVVWTSSTCTYPDNSRISKKKLWICRIKSNFYDSLNKKTEKEFFMLPFMHLQMCFLPNFALMQLYVLPN